VFEHIRLLICKNQKMDVIGFGLLQQMSEHFILQCKQKIKEHPIKKTSSELSEA
jgi:hypothetical protein